MSGGGGEELAGLIARTALGDRNAFAGLYRASAAKLFGVSLRIVRERPLAEEALQDSFVNIWNHASEYARGKSAPMTWMTAIVRNRSLDIVRRSREQPDIDEELTGALADESAAPAREVEARAQAHSVNDCLLSPDAAQALAAAYALGTLPGRARRRLEDIARGDDGLASLMRRWELALAPLAANVPAVDPPARVWREIESRLSPRTSNLEPRTSGFWRAFALIAGGLATVLAAFFVWMAAVPRDDALFVAVLTAQDSGPRAVVSMHEPDTLRVRIVKPWRNVEGKSLELWVLPTEGAPRSLGLVANAGGETLIRIRATDPRMRSASALAVSLEPAGGSPTKLPSGPVLCSGAIAPAKI